MEKSQYSLCLEVLRRLDKAGILKSVILIGSWCALFYEKYFTKTEYIASIRTRDIDFLVPIPPKTTKKVNVPSLLKDLGFIVDFRGSQGYIRLEHPELIVEFLVPERGRGMSGPYRLPSLGLNAQPLRFLDFLTKDTIKLKVSHIAIILPHPAYFALHKLIIFQRRVKSDKKDKDKQMAVNILRALIRKGEVNIIRKAFTEMPNKWRVKILRGLEATGEDDLAAIIKTP